MKNKTKIFWLKVSSGIGLFLLALGHYLISSVDLPTKMGVKGIIISACCLAFGFILILPTKIYITYLLMNKENAKRQLKKDN